MERFSVQDVDDSDDNDNDGFGEVIESPLLGWSGGDRGLGEKLRPPSLSDPPSNEEANGLTKSERAVSSYDYLAAPSSSQASHVVVRILGRPSRTVEPLVALLCLKPDPNWLLPRLQS